MAPTAIAVNDLLNTLEEEDLMSALSYIQFLSANRKKAKAEQGCNERNPGNVRR